MNSTNSIFETDATVVISEREYRKLLEYKAICQEIYAHFGGDSE